MDQDFITNGAAPCGVAVDGEHLYWRAYQTSPPSIPPRRTIARANLDGSGVDLNSIPDADAACAVAVDGAHIYWPRGVPLFEPPQSRVPTWMAAAWKRTSSPSVWTTPLAGGGRPGHTSIGRTLTKRHPLAERQSRAPTWTARAWTGAISPSAAPAVWRSTHSNVTAYVTANVTGAVKRLQCREGEEKQEDRNGKADGDGPGPRQAGPRQDERSQGR